MRTLRNIGAVVLGLFAGMAVNMGFIMLNSYMLFPMPEGIDMNDPEQMNAYVATLPTAAFLVVLLAHLGQSFVGGWVAARVGASRPMLLAPSRPARLPPPPALPPMQAGPVAAGLP